MNCSINQLPQALVNSLNKLAAAAFCLVAVVGMALQADAAIMYGDFSDVPPGGVMYLDVEESSFSNPMPPGPPLYGAPSISGNTLSFVPSGFGTFSSGGASALIDGQVDFVIDALPGAGLTGFSIVERGDFSFSGTTPSPSTFVSASAGASVSILEVDGTALANPISVFASEIFVTDYPTTGGAPSTGLLPWSLVTFVDLGSAISFPYTEGATKVQVSIDNQLSTATAGPGSQAAIAKKGFSIVPVGNLDPNMIPEPTSLALACFAGLAGVVRRRVR